MNHTSTQKIVAALLGFAMVLTLVVGVTVSSASADTMTTTTTTTSSSVYTRNLTVGSRGADVTSLQTTLAAAGYFSVAPTGYFGNITKAAVKAWQAAVGLPSTGFFGPLSRAQIGGSAPVAGTPGCPAGAMYNSMTGAPCAMTTPGTVTGNNTDGSVTASYSPYASSGQSLKKGDTKDIMAVQLQATAGPVSVTRLDVHFSVRPWLFFSKLTLHDAAGNVIGTKLLTGSTDATEVTVGSDYLVRFDGINTVVTPGTNTTLVVSASVLPTTDKIPSIGQPVSVTIPTGSIRTINGKGYTDSVGISNTNTITLLSTGSNGDVLARISPSSPAQRIVTTNATNQTTNVVLGQFDLKSQNNSSTINALSFSLRNSTNAATSTIFSNVRLVNGSSVYGANSLSAGAPTFTNLNINLPQDQWTTLTLEADIAAAVNGVSASSTLLADGNNIIGVDANYNTVTASVGNLVTSNDVTLATAGISVTNVSVTRGSAIVQSNSTTGYNETFAFTVTNTGNNDVFISKDPNVALATSTTGTVGSSTLSSVVANSSVVPGDTSTSYVIPAGTSRIFTYSGAIRGTTGTSVRLSVTQIRYGISSAANNASNINFGLDNLYDTVNF